MFFPPDTHKAFFFIPHPLPPRNADRELEVEDSSCTHKANKQEDRAGTLFTGNITKQLHQSQASRLRLACCIRNKLLWLGIEYLWHAAKCSLNWDIPLLKWAWVGLCFFQLLIVPHPVLWNPFLSTRAFPQNVHTPTNRYVQVFVKGLSLSCPASLFWEPSAHGTL